MPEMTLEAFVDRVLAFYEAPRQYRAELYRLLAAQQPLAYCPGAIPPQVLLPPAAGSRRPEAAVVESQRRWWTVHQHQMGSMHWCFLPAEEWS
jgi:hypothetical protein